MNLAQALSAGRWTFSVVDDPTTWDLRPDTGSAPIAPTTRTHSMSDREPVCEVRPTPPRSMYRRPPKATPRYKNGRTSPVRDRLLAALKGGRLTRGEIVRRMSGMDSVAVDVLLCRLVQKGLILRTKEPGARAFYALAGESA